MVKSRDIKTIISALVDLGWLVNDDLPMIEEQVIECLKESELTTIETFYRTLGKLDE